MKKFAGFLKGLRMVIKYAGLIIIIIDVLSYAADKIEKYLLEKDPSLKNEIGGEDVKQ